MIIYLTNENINARRLIDQHTTVDNLAVALTQHGIRTRIITKSKLLMFVDQGLMPTTDNDIIFVRDIDQDILNYLKPLKNREFTIINSFDTLTTIREFLSTASKLASAGIPARTPFNDQKFSKVNLDRTQGFGQGFEDFIIEHIKDNNIKNFNLIPSTKIARYGYFDNTKLINGYSVSDFNTFEWGSVDLTTSYYILEGLPSKTIRIPVINKLPIFDAALSTNEHFIDNLKIEKNTDVSNVIGLEEIVYKTISTLELEIGFIDLQIINEELKVFNVSNLDQDHNNPYNLDSHIVKFLADRHGN